MFVQITNIKRWHNGQQTQPQTICARPTVRTIANKGNEDTLPS
jgi:hypothetical protein